MAKRQPFQFIGLIIGELGALVKEPLGLMVASAADCSELTQNRRKQPKNI